MSKLILMCGPSGSGKSTYSKQLEGYTYINQDSQGKDGHLVSFASALLKNENIVVDRLNFNKEQRDRYLQPARDRGYTTKIVVLHVPYEECLKRCLERQGHETIKDEKNAYSALNMFFSKYESVRNDEADVVERSYGDNTKIPCIIIDLDGTLCNIDHRLHFVKGDGKKDWRSFFESLRTDTLNTWCAKILHKFSTDHQIVLCSGRPNEYREITINWLKENYIYPFQYDLYMRKRHDFRSDFIIKEQILDFEILTRYNVLMSVDDRGSVCDMWRKRGIPTLQCAEGFE